MRRPKKASSAGSSASASQYAIHLAASRRLTFFFVALAITLTSAVWVSGASAVSLPDGRGYELVSPADKHGGDLLPDTSRARAAVDGDAIGFASLTSFADALGTGVDTDYLSVRNATPGTPGWTTHATTPQQGPVAVVGAAFGLGPYYDADFSPDLSHAVYRMFGAFPGDVNVLNVPNLYLRDDLRTPGAGHYQLLTNSVAVQPPPTALGQLPRPAGQSADFTHVIFESNLNLTADASGTRFKLYESHAGTVRLAGILPNGAATTASGAGQGASVQHYTPRTISQDGSRIFFTKMTGTKALFARIDGAVTVQLNASERTSPESPSSATYWSASTDGTRVFFTTTEGLVDEDTNADNDLYMWKKASIDETQQVTVDATSGTFTLTFNGQTTDPIAFDASADVVRGALSGLVNIGSGNVEVTGGPGAVAPYVVRFIGSYAGANVAEMTADGSSLAGGAASAVVETTQPVQNLTLISRDAFDADAPVTRNLVGASEDGRYVYFTASGQLLPDADSFPDGAGIYVWHEGALRYVGWLMSIPDVNRNSPLLTWITVFNTPPVRVSPDGLHLLFASHTDQGLIGHGGFGGADHGTSCSFDHEAAGACRELYLYDADTGSLQCTSCNVGAPATGDALTAHREHTGGSSNTSHLSHALSDDGRYVFFATTDPLVPQDVNGKLDVYEYDAATETQHLLSSGTSSSDSYLMDASASGRDAFFLTRDRLVGWDTDTNYDMYDARAGGGLPDPPAALDECSDDACQGPLSGLPESTRVSSLFGGAGNVNEGTRSTISGLRKLSSSDRSTLAKGGKARLRLKVNRSGTVTVTGTAKVGKKNRRVLSASARAKKAGAVSIPFGLSRSALSELSSKRSLTVRLTVRFKNARPKVVSVTLRSAASKKGGRS